MWLRKIAVIVGMALAMTVPSVALAADGSAACGAVVHRFAYTIDPLGDNGFYSHLDPQALHLCTGDANTTRGSFSFAAVERTYPGGCSIGTCPNSIIQIGRGLCFDPLNPSCFPNSGQRLIVGWGRDPEAVGCTGRTLVRAVPEDKGPAPTDTGLHYYRVHDDPTGIWRFSHWPKGQPVVTVKSVDESQICWGVREGVTFNETFNVGDSLGGYAANHYNFLSMTRLQNQSGSWEPSLGYQCGLANQLAVDHCATTGQQAWEAWSDR